MQLLQKFQVADLINGLVTIDKLAVDKLLFSGYTLHLVLIGMIVDFVRAHS